MIGVILGVALSLALILVADANWWLLLIGAVVGGLTELSVRLGAGEEFADALGNAVTMGIDLSSAGGGDSGGGGGSFDCGGGGDGGGGGCSGGD